MEFKHKSVLLEEAVAGLNIKPDGIYVDGTLGGGGHSFEICKRLSPKGTLIGIDRDQDALDAASVRLKDFSCNKVFVKSNYASILQVLEELEVPAIDGGLLDLGVSSFQLDNKDRGFSYMADAPLDMRMDQGQGFCGKDVVNQYTKEELTRIISSYGEEKWASRIASFIVNERNSYPIETTGQLVEIIKKAVPARARRDGPHPAKRTFQAIRIEVNRELELLQGACEDFIEALNPGGRLCIITFHSLEDRIVKEVFAKAENPCTCPKGIPICVCEKKPLVKRIGRKPIVPSDAEVAENPRARSAKLRICQKRGEKGDD